MIIFFKLRVLMILCSAFTWPPDKDMLSIPWDSLSMHPDVYYDTSTFHLPIHLVSPQLQLGSPPDVYALVTYFTKSPHPFLFHPKSEIITRSIAQAEKDGMDQAAGDEDDEEEPSTLPLCPPCIPTAPMAEPLSMLPRLPQPPTTAPLAIAHISPVSGI